MATARARFRRLYVWEFPVRFFHWTNAICVFVLIGTGYIIGNPPALTYANEAYQQYWFGTVRFIHFVTAFLLFFNFVFRIYWGFVGNRYARWKNFIPHKASQFAEIKDVLRIDALQGKASGRISIGHNALAGFAYFVSFLMFALQVVTGFALYSSMSTSFLAGLFAWAVPLFGGDFAVRHWHHTTMWFFVIFTLVHLYLVFYHDYLEGRGTTSSMVGGWKFAREDEID